MEFMASGKRLLYYVMCVSAFARVKKLNQKDAYNYLEDFKGIDFLEECYEAEHQHGKNGRFSAGSDENVLYFGSF